MSSSKRSKHNAWSCAGSVTTSAVHLPTAVVELFRKEGAAVAFLDIREDRTAAVMQATGALGYVADIADRGAVFAAKIGSVFPHSFNVLVSITALSLLIIGGIGSLPGVIVGALALVGIPELLREFTEYRLLIYGAVLIVMMLNRPEGLIPSRQRARELHEEERSQDAWLRASEPAASTLSTSPGSSE